MQSGKTWGLRRLMRPTAILLTTLLRFIALAWNPTLNHIRASVLLMKFSGANESFIPSGLGNYALQREDIQFDGSNGQIKARLYLPVGVARPPGIVMHGANDGVVPASEALWLAHGLAANGRTPHTLISRAVGHVEMAGDPT